MKLFEFYEKEVAIDVKENYSKIISKIDLLDKKTRQKYRMLFNIKLNDAIKAECLLKYILTAIGIFFTVLSLAIAINNPVNEIINERMNEEIKKLEAENQEGYGVVGKITKGEEKEKVFSVLTYNFNTKEWEFGATKSEIDFYRDNIENNNKWINQERLSQTQQYNSMRLIIIFIMITLSVIILCLAYILEKIKKLKNIIMIFDYGNEKS